MNFSQIITDDFVFMNSYIVYPESTFYKTKILYDIPLFGEHQWRPWLIDLELHNLCDFSLNQNIVWDSIIEKELENGVLRFDELSRLFVKKIAFSKLTPEKLHEIVKKNIACLTNVKNRYEELKLIKEIEKM